MVILLILFILILTLVASLVFRLMGISGRPYSKIDLCIENVRVSTNIEDVSCIKTPLADMRNNGLSPEFIELTPNAYNWLCKELGRGCVTHVSGVPVKVIDHDH